MIPLLAVFFYVINRVLFSTIQLFFYKGGRIGKAWGSRAIENNSRQQVARKENLGF